MDKKIECLFFLLEHLKHSGWPSPHQTKHMTESFHDFVWKKNEYEWYLISEKYEAVISENEYLSIKDKVINLSLFNEPSEDNINSLVISSPTVRVFNVNTKIEESASWDAAALKKFGKQILKPNLKDGDIIHFCIYRKIHRVIRNFDRNELFIYWENKLSYDPFIEYEKSKNSIEIQ